nr:matrix metalloproteinase 17-2 [Nemopilema nomurai]
MSLYAVLFIIVQATSLYSFPIDLSTNIDQEGLNYLAKYGYLVRPDPRKGTILDEKKIAEGLKALQRMGGLPETGTLNEATKKLILSPRCGMADFSPSDSVKRKRRYKRHGSIWNKRNLTWAIANSNNDNIKDEDVKETILNALKKWSAITEIDFTEDKNNPDIWIRFTRKYHNDASPFDGRGGELAHAFYPANDELSGDVHYDDDEVFSIKSSQGRDLLWITVHEVGHSLGLDHSGTQGSVMNAFYRETKGLDFNLHADDIKGAQSLYGVRDQPATSSPPPEPGNRFDKEAKPLQLCLNKVQASVLTANKETYIVNGDKSYILNRYLRGTKGPILTSKLFGGLNKIDAIFRRQWDQKLVAFSGNKYYVFEDTKLVEGPYYISDGFKGLPANFADIRAAFIWPGNNQLYIFKGRQYWRFSRIPNQDKYQMDYYYPRKTRYAWRGVPEDFDSVLAWRRGKVYFFKGDKYYRFSNTRFNVEYGYPRSVWEDWSGCPSQLAVTGAANTRTATSTIALLLPLLIFFLFWN